jgi:hypothetical protein
VPSPSPAAPVAYHGDLTDEADRIGVPAHKMLAHALVNHGTEFRGPGGVAVDHGRRVMCVLGRWSCVIFRLCCSVCVCALV